MTRNDDFVYVKIKAIMAFVISRVTKEDARSGSRREFVRIIDVRETKAT